MTRAPFGYTLLGASTVCCTFWTVALNQIEYVGTLAFMGLQLCAACWLIIGVVNLIKRIHQAFTFGSRDLADFVAGKATTEKEALKKERLEAVRRAVSEAKARKEAASKGLKQPNQSSTVRYLNERISALICEQLQLEAILGKKGVA